MSNQRQNQRVEEIEFSSVPTIKEEIFSSIFEEALWSTQPSVFHSLRVKFAEPHSASTLNFVVHSKQIDPYSHIMDSIKRRFQTIRDNLEDEIDPMVLDDIISRIVQLFEEMHVSKPVIGLAEDGRLVFEWGKDPKTMLVVYPSYRYSILQFENDKIVVKTQGEHFVEHSSSQHLLKTLIGEYGRENWTRGRNFSERRFIKVL